MEIVGIVTNDFLKENTPQAYFLQRVENLYLVHVVHLHVRIKDKFYPWMCLFSVIKFTVALQI